MEVSENAGMSLLSTDWVPRVSGMSIGSLGDHFLGVADSISHLDCCANCDQLNVTSCEVATGCSWDGGCTGTIASETDLILGTLEIVLIEV